MKRSLLFLLAISAPMSLLAQEIPIQSAPPHAAPQMTTLWNLFQSGGFAMYPLLLLSILSVMLIFGFWITFRRGAVVSNQYMNTAEVLLKKGDYTGMLAISARHGEAIARVVQRTLEFASHNPQTSFEVIKEIAQTEGASQAASMQNRVTYLADIAVLSPMLGLLGTVFGLIRSFGAMGSPEVAAAQSATRNILLAEGVSEALVATCTGLLIGIVAMGFYGLFRNKVQKLLSDLERASAHLIGMMATQGFAGMQPEAPAARRKKIVLPKSNAEEGLF